MMLYVAMVFMGVMGAYLGGTYNWAGLLAMCIAYALASFVAVHQ